MTFLLYISLVYESNMPQAKNIFFGFVGLCMVTAAAFQFLIVFDINDKCDVSPVSLSLPPTIAGACLTFSFFANAAWLLARRSNGNSSGARVALLVWSAAVSAGMVAAGATLGQIPLYPTVCPTLGSTINFQTLQCISIALLVFSTVAPHGVKKSKDDSRTDGAGAPITFSTSAGATDNEKSPLVFL